jgi:L-amino acid N-acyltransferase YncA
MLKTNSRNLLLRTANFADTQSVADIYNQYIKNGLSTMDRELKTADDIQSWLESFSDRETLLVLEKNDQIIGWGIIKKYSEREGYRYACETAVYLDAGEVGQGYGTFIKKAIIERCREMDYHHLVAKIFSDNKGSIVYNQKLGYEIVGEQKEIGERNGEWMNVTIMQLLL